MSALPAFDQQCFHKFVIKLLAIKRFFVTQVQTAHWSYAATHWRTAATVRILDRNEVVYTGLAHRHRAIVKAAPFAVAANLPLASARCAHRCLVRCSRATVSPITATSAFGAKRNCRTFRSTIILTQIKGFTEVLCSISGGTFSNVAMWEHSDGNRSYH
jgi:hypothetical protein